MGRRAAGERLFGNSKVSMVDARWTEYINRKKREQEVQDGIEETKQFMQKDQLDEQTKAVEQGMNFGELLSVLRYLITRRSRKADQNKTV